MARLGKRQLPADFPKHLIDRACTYHGEIAWNKDDAALVVEWLHGRGAAAVSVELWLFKNGAPQPHIKTATGLATYRYWTTTRPSETWEAFASRTLNEATTFIRRFQWPENATESGEQDVRFCLEWVWRNGSRRTGSGFRTMKRRYSNGCDHLPQQSLQFPHPQCSSNLDRDSRLVNTQPISRRQFGDCNCNGLKILPATD
jgi:hypothetical protein